MTKEEYLLLLDDDGKLKRKFANKKYNAKKEGLNCLLSFEEFCELLIEAGLKSSDIGFHSEHKIVLARYGDEGDYTIDNCRFISQKENMLEQKQSEAQLLARRKNIKAAQQYIESHKEECVQKQISGLHNSQYLKNRLIAAEEKRKVREESLDKRYCGKHNSMYGKRWITNGICNALVRGDLSALPADYRYGRTINTKQI